MPGPFLAKPRLWGKEGDKYKYSQQKQGHGVANDHAAFDHGDQARLPKFLRFMNISLHR